MRLPSLFSLLAAALLLTASPGLHAQTTVAAADLPTEPGPILYAGTGPITIVPMLRPIKSAPFSANYRSEGRQVLADGATITNSRSGKLARDSEGRTYLETSTEHGPASNPQTFTSVNINDPVAGVQIFLMPDHHTARRLERAGPTVAGLQSLTPSSPSAANEPATTALAGAPVRSVNPDGLTATRQTRPATNKSGLPPVQKEDLGEDSIDGIPVHHYRETRTIPAGYAGNDRDLVITSELWYSKDLQLFLKSIRNDPRSGEETLTVTDIDRSAPSASLFEIPADYTVTDAPSPRATATGVAASGPAEKP